MSEEEILEILRTRLSLDVITKSEYNGKTVNGRPMYTDHHILRLILDNEVISEVSF